MTDNFKFKLNKILKDNSKWPLIIEGVSARNFPNAVVIPSITPSSELGIIPGETGLKYPAWVMEIMIKSKKSKKIMLCIDLLDKLPKGDQEKFYGIIKYNGINGYKFPDGTQIIITTGKGGIDKLSKRIVDLTITYRME